MENLIVHKCLFRTTKIQHGLDTTAQNVKQVQLRQTAAILTVPVVKTVGKSLVLAITKFDQELLLKFQILWRSNIGKCFIIVYFSEPVTLSRVINI